MPSLQKYAHAQKLEDIETEVAKYFSNWVSDEDKEALRLCRQLRNKVLHCDFRAARDKLEELGGDRGRGDVKAIDVCGLSGTPLAEKVRGAGANVDGTFQYVADTSSTEPGTVFGWLLELGMADDFRKAVEAFSHASAIIDRLARHGVQKPGA